MAVKMLEFFTLFLKTKQFYCMVLSKKLPKYQRKKSVSLQEDLVALKNNNIYVMLAI